MLVQKRSLGFLLLRVWEFELLIAFNSDVFGVALAVGISGNRHKFQVIGRDGANFFIFDMLNDIVVLVLAGT